MQVLRKWHLVPVPCNSCIPCQADTPRKPFDECSDNHRTTLALVTEATEATVVMAAVKEGKEGQEGKVAMALEVMEKALALCLPPLCNNSLHL